MLVLYTATVLQLILCSVVMRHAARVHASAAEGFAAEMGQVGTRAGGDSPGPAVGSDWIQLAEMEFSKNIPLVEVLMKAGGVDASVGAVRERSELEGKATPSLLTSKEVTAVVSRNKDGRRRVAIVTSNEDHW